MELYERDMSGVAVVDVIGKLLGEPEHSDEFYSLIRSLGDRGQRKIVVNLGDAPWVNSKGLGVLISAHSSVMKEGGELVLANVPKRINNILNVTKLFLIFKSFDTEDAAAEYLLERYGTTASSSHVAQ